MQPIYGLIKHHRPRTIYHSAVTSSPRCIAGGAGIPARDTAIMAATWE
ncbi:MAG: hypothetical protein ACK5C8_04725 [Roseiflexaceae bacterium]|nr:hypothetical protein [Chloroflexaceae bacterium]